jgi:hypothetical protein
MTMADYFWKHFCKAERSYLYVADKQPCNWCDAPQSGPLTRIYTDEQGRRVKVTVNVEKNITRHPLKNIKVL